MTALEVGSTGFALAALGAAVGTRFLRTPPPGPDACGQSAVGVALGLCMAAAGLALAVGAAAVAAQ